jgi:hypothetical protein
MMIVIAAAMVHAFQLTQIQRMAASSNYLLFVKRQIAHPPLPEFQSLMLDCSLLWPLAHGRAAA